MDFGIGRSALLNVLADVMMVETTGGGAFLGRFQHLQRLRLVEGINPGRGKQAQYRANQVLVIAIAMQLLQLGLTPERAVRIIRDNQDRVRLCISLAVPSKDSLSPAFLYFDPALLTELGDKGGKYDFAEQTFHYAGQGTLKETIEDFLIEGDVPRLAIVNVKGTIAAIKDALFELDLGAASDLEIHPEEGPTAANFHYDLHNWVSQSTPDSLE